MVQMFFSLLLFAGATAIILSAVVTVWSLFDQDDSLRSFVAARDDLAHREAMRREVERRRALRLANSKWFRPMTKPGAEEEKS